MCHFSILGSGCGSVGRVVASKSRGPQFESSHRNVYCQLYLKDENKEKKRPVIGSILKISRTLPENLTSS